MKRCKIDKTVKCGYHKCVPTCKVFQNIGQTQLVPTEHTQDFSQQSVTTERRSKTREAYEEMHKVLKRKGHTTKYYSKSP